MKIKKAGKYIKRMIHSESKEENNFGYQLLGFLSIVLNRKDFAELQSVACSD